MGEEVIKFDPTIGLGSICVMVTLICAGFAAWYGMNGKIDKVNSRLDLVDYRVKAIEDTLKLIGDTLKQLAETDKRISLIDQRQASQEELVSAMVKTVEGLKRGEGYIQTRRANVDGLYSTG